MLCARSCSRNLGADFISEVDVQGCAEKSDLTRDYFVLVLTQRYFIEVLLIYVRIQSADACEWSHRQRRLSCLGWIADQLVTAILIPQTGKALDQHQKLDHRARQSDDRNRQLQDQNHKLHRRITSFLEGGRCCAAGLTPLTLSYFTVAFSYIQTNVRVMHCASCAVESSACSRIIGGSAVSSLATEYRKAA